MLGPLSSGLNGLVNISLEPSDGYRAGNSLAIHLPKRGQSRVGYVMGGQC
jgi:hypothetical protein